MKVLIVKTSSLGDIIHTLPAVSDANKNMPNLTLHWVCEESFAEVPVWHSRVSKVIPLALRRWRKNIISAIKSGAIKEFFQELHQENYDLIIDAQGLLKSAFITAFCHGKSVGFNFHSAREGLATLFYSKHYDVATKQHAVYRLRQLFASALNYPLPNDSPDFGITPQKSQKPAQNNVVFIHGTTRKNKCWDETNWIGLAKLINEQGFKVLLPWGNEEEKNRAARIAQNTSNATVLTKTTLTALKDTIGAAKAVVAVDTGLGHLAAALNVPTISLYGATDPKLIGTLGLYTKHLLTPQINTSATTTVQISINEVWRNLLPLLKK